MSQNLKLTPISKKLRSSQTPWENKLWNLLRAKRFLGIKFKRQVIIENFVVDFCSFSKKIIIELDGGHHFEKEMLAKDQNRDRALTSLGYKILRFSNLDIDKNIDGVWETIRQSIK